MKNRSFFYALSCVLVWSFIPVLSKMAQLRVGNLQFLLMTNLLSVLSVGCVLSGDAQQYKRLFYRANHVHGAILGFLGCFFYYLCLYWGYAHLPPVRVLTLQYLWPALIPVFAVFILKEPLSRRTGLSIFLGFCAMVITVYRPSEGLRGDDIFPLGVVFIGAVSFALFSVLSKRFQGESVSLDVFIYFLWATIFSAIAVVMFEHLVMPDSTSLILIAVNGIIVNGLSYILWIKALSGARTSRIAPLVYASPVLSMVWIYLFFDGVIGLSGVIAVLLVLISGLLGLKSSPAKEDRPVVLA